MAKNLKLNIKNSQIANAVNLSGLKEKLAGKKVAAEEISTEKETLVPKTVAKTVSKKEPLAVAPTPESAEKVVESPRVKARSRSAFAEPMTTAEKSIQEPINVGTSPVVFEEEEFIEETVEIAKTGRTKTNEELRKEIFAEELEEQRREKEEPIARNILLPPIEVEPIFEAPAIVVEELVVIKPIAPQPVIAKPVVKSPTPAQTKFYKSLPKLELKKTAPREFAAPAHKLGPTGKHIKDLIPERPPVTLPEQKSPTTPNAKTVDESKNRTQVKPKVHETPATTSASDDADKKPGNKNAQFKEFRDIKPAIKRTEQGRFDARDKQGLRENDDDKHWRRKRVKQSRHMQEDLTIRPTTLKVRIPISIKDLAVEMKLKASQLIAKLFAQGVIVTLNDLLEDTTTLQLLGQEFGCEIEIDTSEEQRIRVTDKTIKEEVQAANPADLIIRPPVVAFMGHVDHGKTSLIDAIRKSNRVSGEAGAITQHIGAFRCSTPVGDIAILDTPGHEAFSAMRERGADVTDIVVLVIAGDEGIRQQTIEAMNHAKAAKVTIVVALNKCDKPNFNAENVYRQLAENDLLPEAWGGQTITVNCSAVTEEGIPQLLEMLALQAEVLELKADPTCRARGMVLESELHKGMGCIATVLVQNGSLHCGDSLVFGQHWGRIKTMRNEHNHELEIAGPSTPIEITGLSGLPEAGEEFIVVKSEKEARAISSARTLGVRQTNLLLSKKISMDNLVQQAGEATKKVLNLVIRADVQGSLEALKVILMKITSTKALVNIISAGVGEVSESDVQLAATSKAVIIGFHTQIESHADALVKQLGVQVRLHNIIYHAVDDVKSIMTGLLDKIVLEVEKGKAEVRTTFKSSHHGIIAGCIVSEGSIHRSNSVRLRRGNEIVWKGTISSLKRVKEDVREISKGLECGIILNNFSGQMENDIIEAYEITYITQEL